MSALQRLDQAYNERFAKYEKEAGQESHIKRFDSVIPKELDPKLQQIVFKDIVTKCLLKYRDEDEHDVDIFNCLLVKLLERTELDVRLKLAILSKIRHACFPQTGNNNALMYK